MHARVLRHLRELGRDTKFYSIRKMGMELRKNAWLGTVYGTRYTCPG